MFTSPSDAELAILAVLWQKGPSTVREVHQTLAKSTGYTSTLKQMQLMLEKGFVRRSERYRSHVYEAALTKEAMQTQVAGDLLDRVFEKSAKSMVLGALNAQNASDADLKEIRQMLDEYQKSRKTR